MLATGKDVRVSFFRRVKAAPRRRLRPGAFSFYHKSLTGVDELSDTPRMKILTTEQAAATVKISRASLQEWIRRKKIEAPAVQLVGGKAVRLWKPADVAKLRKAKARIYGKGRGPRPKAGRKS